MKRFVIDASVTMAWCFEDQADPSSEKALKAVGAGAAALVPALWIYETCNVLALTCRKGTLARGQADTFWRNVVKMVEIDDKPDMQAANRIIDLAERHVLTAYDAAYLELATRKSLPLATLDKDLRKAAHAIGIALFN